MTVIHFIRHGEVHNPEGILYGRLPHFGLSAAGRQQAAALAEHLRGRALDAVYASPMLRTRQTAGYILQHHPHLTLRISRLINETYTPHEGRPLQELEASGWNMYEDVPAGYEHPEDIFNRAQRFIRRVREAYPAGEVAAVSHGELLLWMHLWKRGLPFTPETQFKIRPFPEPASITTLVFEDGASAPQELRYHRPY